MGRTVQKAGTAAPKRRGRPPLPADQRKRASINTRLRPPLKERLEARAAEHGRSLSEEIESRLEQSEQIYESFGGYDTYRFMQLLGGTIFEIEQTTGKSWRTDLETLEQVREALDLMLLVFSRGVENHPLPTAARLGSPHHGLGKSKALRAMQYALAVERLARALSEPIPTGPSRPGAKLAASLATGVTAITEAEASSSAEGATESRARQRKGPPR